VDKSTDPNALRLARIYGHPLAMKSWLAYNIIYSIYIAPFTSNDQRRLEDMGNTYQLGWLYRRNKWVFNSAQKVFRSGESLRERGNGFQTEGAADIKLLRPYRLHFIFGTHKSLE
jgi:hypothetical protein